MKRGTGAFGAILIFSLGILLFSYAGQGIPESRQQAVAAWVLAKQVGEGHAVFVIPAPSLDPSPSPTPGKVPVTVVEEAWDELEREETYLTSPVPVLKVPTGDYSMELRNETEYSIDYASLPGLPTPEELTVLIVHTHGTEGYADSAAGNYRTLEEGKSVLAVGDKMAETLEGMGISVIHDRTLCDYPEYNGAYNRSRQVIENNLYGDPGIFLVLDVHRDAVSDGKGGQKRMAATVSGQEVAQLMLVVGTDAGGLNHPEWRENFSLGAVVHGILEENYPGLMRPLNLRTERFNQDLAPLSLLVEVGTSGNSLQEALGAGELFAQALGQVLLGCQK